jgi:hypothetical protein
MLLERSRRRCAGGFQPTREPVAPATSGIDEERTLGTHSMDNLCHNPRRRRDWPSGTETPHPSGEPSRLMVSANLPDLDVAGVSPPTRRRSSFRRGWTHGVLAAGTAAVGARRGVFVPGTTGGGGASGCLRSRPFIRCGWVGLGYPARVYSHVFLDLLEHNYWRAPAGAESTWRLVQTGNTMFHRRSVVLWSSPGTTGFGFGAPARRDRTGPGGVGLAGGLHRRDGLALASDSRARSSRHSGPPRTGHPLSAAGADGRARAR